MALECGRQGKVKGKRIKAEDRVRDSYSCTGKAQIGTTEVRDRRSEGGDQRSAVSGETANTLVSPDANRPPFRSLPSPCTVLSLSVGVMFALLVFHSDPCYALEPSEILVVANMNASSSIGLAGYYMQRRGIPEANLVRLWVTDQESCSRTEYEKKVLGPVRKFISEHPSKRRIRCLVTVLRYAFEGAAAGNREAWRGKIWTG